MQRRGGCKYNGQRDDRAERHAGQRVDTDALKFRPGFLGRDAQRFYLMPFLLFNLLSRLPEKQIRANSGP